MNFTKYKPVNSRITDKYEELVNNPTHNLTDSENTFKDLLSSTEQFDLSRYVCLFSNAFTDLFTDILINYSSETRQIAHVIIIDDISAELIKHCKFLESVRLIQLVIIETTLVGGVDFNSLIHKIRRNTCLISINAINPNTGYINDIALIGERCKKIKIPLHVNVTHYIDLNIIAPSLFNIDCFTISFNVSCMHVIKRIVYDGYNLHYPISTDIYRFVSTYVEYNGIINNRKLMISSCPAKKEYFIKKLSEKYKVTILTPEFVLDECQIILMNNGIGSYLSSILAISIIIPIEKDFTQYMKDNNILIDDCTNRCTRIISTYKLPNLYSIYLKDVKTPDIDKFIELLKKFIS
jgi:hypothetical protein